MNWKAAAFLFVIVVAVAAIVATVVVMKGRRGHSGIVGRRGMRGRRGPTGSTGSPPESSVAFVMSLGPVGEAGLLVSSETEGGIALGHGSCDGASVPVGIPSAGQVAMALEAFTIPFDGEIGEFVTAGQIQSTPVPNALHVAIWIAPPTGPTFTESALAVDSPTVGTAGPTDYAANNLADRVAVSRGDRVVPFAVARDDADSAVLLFRLGGSFRLFAANP